MNFYTNVQNFSGYILYRGVKDGKRVKERIDYHPSLFIPSKKITSFTNLEGDYLDQKVFKSIKAAKEYMKQFDGVANAPKIYGQTRYEYAFIADQHRGMVEWDKDKVEVSIIDIEVGSENGFPDPYEANEPITAIAIKTLGNPNTWVFGCGAFDSQGVGAIYRKCKDEYDLCKKFLEHWQKFTPDALTGWNTKFFDMPYLVNRFRKVLGEDETKKLSPWNFIGERKTVINGREMIAYELLGVSSLDYIELYKWYAPGGKSQESYQIGRAHV